MVESFERQLDLMPVDPGCFAADGPLLELGRGSSPAVVPSSSISHNSTWARHRLTIGHGPSSSSHFQQVVGFKRSSFNQLSPPTFKKPCSPVVELQHHAEPLSSVLIHDDSPLSTWKGVLRSWRGRSSVRGVRGRRNLQLQARPRDDEVFVSPMDVLAEEASLPMPPPPQ